jgi:hypothetical protein
MMDEPYLSALRSKKKLERDKGLEIVKEVLRSAKGGDIVKLEANILELLGLTGGWESTHGALCASALMLEAGICSDEFYKEVEKTVPALLDHNVPRLRLAAGLWGGGVVMN